MDFLQQGTKEEIIYWSKRLYQKGMSPSTSGNVSTKTKDGILISASGVCLNDMNEEDIILIDYDGNVLNGNKKPSSEKIMHSEIYLKRDDINAIIHCHCPLITAFAVAGKAMDKAILPDFTLTFGKVPIVPYACPSTIELAVNVGNYFEKYSAVLLKNHGVILGASSLQDAFYKIELLRSYVEIFFGAEVLGGHCTLSKKQIKEINQVYKNK